MISVIIDGNYSFYKTFGVFSSFGSKSPGDILASEAERNMFIRKIITDLCYSLNQIPNINRVVFCKDSRSWRKDYKITRSVYKESRIKSEGVDWGSFFNLMNEFGEYSEESGFIYSSFGGAEGDDLIWAWCDYLKNTDDCVIVISGDKDMHQLVEFNGERWTGIWNANSKNNKFIVAKDWYISQDNEPTIFNVTPDSGSSNDKMNKLISSCVVEKIDVKEYVFKKILTGDKKDDVPGVFPYITKNGKNSNITEGKAQKIWNFYLETQWAKFELEEIWDNQDFLGWISGLALRLILQTDNEENRNKFKKFYEENAKLVWLNRKTLPPNLVQGMKSHIKELDAKEKSQVKIDKKEMIDNSPWFKETTPKGFNPFEFFE